MDSVGTIDLDEEQSAAVESDERRVLVNAGAGSGKTRVIIARTERLIRAGAGAGHGAICVITFTRRAAQELRKRVEAIGLTMAAITVGTFHSVAYHVLNSFGPRLGYERPISIYDEWLSADVLSDAMILFGLAPESFRDAEPRKVQERAEKLAILQPDDWVRVVDAYKMRMKTLNAVDFDSIMSECCRLFREYPDVAKEIHNAWLHMLVDEFQDTDPVQLEWIDLINPRHLTVVGDDYQSIYGFRGARFQNIFDIAEQSEDYPVGTNYRSAAAIVETGARLISHNLNQLQKRIRPRPDPPRGNVQIIQSAIPFRQVALLCETIRERFEYGQMAVLCRTNRGAAISARELQLLGIPHRLISRGGFWDSDIVRGIVYTLQAIANPADTMAAIRSLNFPAFRLCQIDRASIHAIAVRERISFRSAAMLYDSKTIREWADHLCKVTDSGKPGYPGASSAEDMLTTCVDTFGWVDYFRKKGLHFPMRAIERIRMEMRRQAEIGDSTLSDFLMWYAIRDSQDDIEAVTTEVTVSTIHAAKGLEWPVVILPGWDADSFPSKKGDIEEERRIAYVAITRAINECYIIRNVDKTPSRFIAEGGLLDVIA
jgi:DNA helicase-2/ATP-dependent DNA helicase PcrA